MKRKELLLAILNGFVSGWLLYFSYKEGLTWLSFLALVPLFFYLNRCVKSVYKFISGTTLLICWHTPLLLFLQNFSPIEEKEAYWFMLLIGATKLIPLIPLILQIKWLYKVIAFAVLWLFVDFVWLNWSMGLPFDIRVSVLSAFFGILINFIPFLAFIKSSKIQNYVFVVLWLLKDWLWLNWDFDCPFFLLGIPLGDYTSIIQWYSITGTLGGSLWLLIINYLVYIIIDKWKAEKKVPQKQIVVLSSILIIPCLFSVYLKNLSSDNIASKTVTVVGYDLGVNEDSAKQKVIDYINTDSIFSDYVLFPECAYYLQNEPPLRHEVFKQLQSKMKEGDIKTNYIVSTIITSFNKRKSSAVMVNKDTLQIRYKQRLVPFSEKVPYSSFFERFPIIRAIYPLPFIVQQDTEPLFYNDTDTVFVAICYEGLFANVLRPQVNNGAQIIFLLTRAPFDGSPTYERLFKLVAKAGAISTKKNLVNAAWGGVSCVIDEKGNILNQNYNKDTVFTTSVYLNNSKVLF